MMKVSQVMHKNPFMGSHYLPYGKLYERPRSLPVNGFFCCLFHENLYIKTKEKFMGFFNKIALRGILYPVLKEKADLAFENRENIDPHWIQVVPYLRLFFSGIADDSNCKDLLKVLAQGNRETIRQISKLLVFWFFYSLDRDVLRGNDDFLENSDVRTYFKRVWFLYDSELYHFTNSLDNANIEKRLVTFCKLICEKLNNDKLLTCLMLYASLHMIGAQKMVLKLDEESLIKLS